MKPCASSLLLGLLALLTSKIPTGTAATVSLVKDQPGVVTLMREGSDTHINIEKGMLLCFMKKQKRLTCGLIIKASPTLLTVKVKRGMNLLHDGQVLDFTAKKVSLVNKKLIYTRSLNLSWSPYFTRQTRANYNVLTYQGAEAAESISSLWKTRSTASADQKAGPLLMSLNAELELKSYKLRFGAGYKSYTPISNEAYYDHTQLDLFLLTETGGYAANVYGDYVFLRFKKCLSLGAGLETEFSKLNISGIQGSDTTSATQTLFALQSTQTIFSLRIPARFDYRFSQLLAHHSTLRHLGFFAGITLALPFYSMGSDTVSTASDPLNRAKISTPLDQDLSEALNHSKAKWSWDANFGAFWLF